MWHWDGNQLLFVTSPMGQLVDVKVGTLGDITPTDTNFVGITFYGRNPAGDISVCYNRSGVVGDFGYKKPRGSWLCPYTAGVTPKLAYQFNDGSGTATGQVPVYLGRDGIYDWINTIQGVRAYDSDSGGWTTPDAYAGDAHDPMSQKSYVWNGDNPVAYSDPSGYLYGENAGALSYDMAVYMDDALGIDSPANFVGATKALPTITTVHVRCSDCHERSAKFAARAEAALHDIDTTMKYGGVGLVLTDLAGGEDDAPGAMAGLRSMRLSRISITIEDITRGASITNLRIGLTRDEFVDELLQSGFTASVSKDGKALNLTNGTRTYSVRGTSNEGSPTAECWVNGVRILKLRLIP